MGSESEALNRADRTPARRYHQHVEPELRLLRYFLAVADELNFTRAARRLHIAQPSLSAQIRQLESQLGVQLLERTTRAVSLTDAGLALQERGPAVLSAVEETWDAARRVGRGVAGRLRIAYSLSASYGTAPHLVQALRDHHPDIEITTEVMPTLDIVPAVRDGRADVGVARTPPAASGVRLRTVRLDRQGVLVGDSHPFAELSEVDLASVAEHPISMHPRAANPSHYDYVVDLFRNVGLVPLLVEPVVAVDPGQRGILEGRYIGLVGAASSTGLAEGLRWVPLAEPTPRVRYSLVLRVGELSPVAARFERVALAVAADEGWLDGAAAH